MQLNFFPSVSGRSISTDPSGLKQVAGFRWLRPVLCAVWLLLPCLLNAQDFTLDWYAVAAGGGESSGGDFELSATIGQPDAGDMLGGDFAILGGFWSIATVVDTPPALSLNVSLAEGSAVISWPENGSGGFALEATDALANPSGNTSWTTVNVTPQASNGRKSVRLPLASGNRFYRLHKL